MVQPLDFSLFSSVASQPCKPIIGLLQNLFTSEASNSQLSGRKRHLAINLILAKTSVEAKGRI